jgi:putative membrane protein
MSPEAQSLLKEWTAPVALNVTIVVTALVYLRGWLSLRRSSTSLFSTGKLVAFLTGMFWLWFAIGSPLSAFDEASLTVHMIQHILLMLVVPPLVLLGAPALPLLHGLPQWMVRKALGPVLRQKAVQALGRFLSHPLVCWISAAVALIGWHVPSAFELALRSDSWHDVEHICFLFTSILFWWPVVQPFPSESRWPRWSIPLYLFFGMLPGGALGAFMVFCERVLYPAYGETPSVFSISPLGEQVIAGCLMWVLGTLACLIPAMIITIRLLSPGLASPEIALPHSARLTAEELSSASGASRL